VRRVILFGPFPPPYGGVSVYVATLYEALRERGVPCERKVARQEDNRGDDPVLPRFRSVLRHFSHLRAGDICIDSSSFFLEYRSGLAPLGWLLLKRTARFRWVKIIHDSTLPLRYPTFGLFRRWLAGRLVEAMDEIVVVSEELGGWLAAMFRVQGKVRVIPGLLPLPKPERSGELPEGIADLLRTREKWVCSVGVFLESYGFLHIARAVEEVRRVTGRDIGLLLVDGGYVLEDVGAYKSSVLDGREWAVPIESIPRGQVMALFRRCAVSVRAVSHESYGLSRVESLLCGTPVVATPVGETRGMLLCDYGNIPCLVRKILEALERGAGPEARVWAERFEQEAEANLRSLLETVVPEVGSA